MVNRVFCKNCGKELPYDQKFCDKCGTKVTLPKEISDGTNQPSIPVKDISRPNGGAEKKINKKIIILLAVALTAVIAGIAAVSILHKTTVDISDAYSVEFYGYDGSGIFAVKGDCEDVHQLVDSENDLTYEAIDTLDFSQANNSNKQGKLKNGDKLKIKIGYSEKAANRAQIKFEGVEKEVTVKGLTKRYKDASELDKDMIKKMTNQADITAKEKAESHWSSGAKSELVKRYYLYDKYTDLSDLEPEDYEAEYDEEDYSDNEGYYYNDTVLFIYKISGESIFSEKRESDYCYVAVTPVNGDYKEGDYGDCSTIKIADTITPNFNEFISELKREMNFPDSKYVWSEYTEKK